MSNETIGGMKRVSFLPDREDGENGTLIGGQEYDNVKFIGGEISGIAVEQALSINDQTDSYTLILSDADDYVRMNKATSNTLTVPPHATVAFPTGTQILVRQVGIGQTTIAAGLGVTINTPSTLLCRAQGSTVALVQTNILNEWDLSGDLEPL
jgi:hypothetical protein